MNIYVRQAGLNTDQALIVETVRRYLTPLSDDIRFDWLYKHNPYGPARTWIAFDAKTHAVAGVASAFPRLFYMHGGEEVGWVLGDFCINDLYRSLGPALQLQRACLEELGAGTVKFCYDFPSLQMMAIYKRLGVSSSDRLTRLTKLLRVDGKVREFVRSPVIGRALSVLVNALLGWPCRCWKIKERYWRAKGRKLTLALHEGCCEEEFSLLARRIGDQFGACVQRSAAYLNWRYVQNPLVRHEIVTARVNEELVAYVVFIQTGGNGTVVDLLGIADPTIMRRTISHTIAVLWRRGITAVNVALSGSHPWIAVFRSLGFRTRESLPIVIYEPTSSDRACITAEVKWLFMQGDRDS